MRWVLWLCIATCIAACTAAAGAANYEIYTVGPNENVALIAARFGVSPDDVRRFNGFDSKFEPAQGQSVAIPIGGLDNISAPTTGSAEPPSTAAPANEDSASPSREPIGQLGIVTARGASIRSRPGAGTILFRPAVGTQLIVTRQSQGQVGILMVDGTTGWIQADAVQIHDVQLVRRSNGEAPPPGSGRLDIVQEAFRYWGVPYKYGGSLPYNVDCSLLVQAVFAAKGVSLPRTAASQYLVGSPVSTSQLLPGDRVYFIGRDATVNHTGIYIGNGQFIHASSNRGVVAVDYLGSSTYWRRFAGARR